MSGGGTLGLERSQRCHSRSRSPVPGAGSVGAIDSLSGTNTVSGPLTLASGASIGAENGEH